MKGEAVITLTPEEKLFKFFADLKWQLDCEAAQLQPATEDRRRFPAACLLSRLTTNLEAIKILRKHSLAIELETILRSALEGVFWLGAIATDEQFLDVIISDDNFRRRTLAKHTLKISEHLTLDKSTLDILAERRDNKTPDGGLDPISIEAAATAARLQNLYPMYLQLSNIAAHVSGASLNRHLTIGTNGEPEAFDAIIKDPDWIDSLTLACEIVFFTKVFQDAIFVGETEQWGDAKWAEFKELANEVRSRGNK